MKCVVAFLWSATKVIWSLTKPTPPPEENVSIRKDQFQFIFLMVLNDKKCKKSLDIILQACDYCLQPGWPVLTSFIVVVSTIRCWLGRHPGLSGRNHPGGVLRAGVSQSRLTTGNSVQTRPPPELRVNQWMFLIMSELTERNFSKSQYCR